MSKGISTTWNTPPHCRRPKCIVSPTERAAMLILWLTFFSNTKSLNYAESEYHKKSSKFCKIGLVTNGWNMRVNYITLSFIVSIWLNSYRRHLRQRLCLPDGVIYLCDGWDFGKSYNKWWEFKKHQYYLCVLERDSARKFATPCHCELGTARRNLLLCCVSMTHHYCNSNSNSNTQCMYTRSEIKCNQVQCL